MGQRRCVVLASLDSSALRASLKMWDSIAPRTLPLPLLEGKLATLRAERRPDTMGKVTPSYYVIQAHAF